MDVNQLTLLGRLTADPELIANGQGVKFCIATGYSYTKDNEKVETTTFMNCVAWSKLAEIIHKFCKKGTRVYAQGRIEQQTYEKEDGTKKVTYKMVCNQLITLDKKVETTNVQDEDAFAADYEQPVSGKRPGDKMDYSGLGEPDEIKIEDVPF